MSDSPPELSHGEIKENWVSPKRPCDFCNEATALLYCRADTAKLCLSCDREVHSTNQLFTKHTRSLLCDSCDSSPASIFCSTDAAVHCQNCDWEAHTKTNSNSNSSGTHDRRPLEGFTGCPSVTDLLAILGFEDLSKKGLFQFGGGGSDSYESGDHGFSDYLVWETPTFVTLDDLIVSSGSHHNYQAMGVPPLPKNRNAACGAYKDELLHQLRKMAKSEPNVDGDAELIKPVCEFKPMLPTNDIQLQDMSAGVVHKSEPNMYSSDEMNAFKWCYDRVDFGDQEIHSNQIQGYNIDANSFVPEKELDVVQSSSHVNASHEGQPQLVAAADNAQVFPLPPPVVVVRELNSQERDSAISRYKEKKKSRRYDKHIRYESRKVRAESRTRIRGRFAKIDR